MTNRDRCLTLLEDAGSNGVSTAEFLRAGCGSRFGARIQELREEGYDISTQPIRSGSYRYTLNAGGGLASSLDESFDSGVASGAEVHYSWRFDQMAPEGERWKLVPYEQAAR